MLGLSARLRRRRRRARNSSVLAQCRNGTQRRPVPGVEDELAGGLASSAAWMGACRASAVRFRGESGPYGLDSPQRSCRVRAAWGASRRAHPAAWRRVAAESVISQLEAKPKAAQARGAWCIRWSCAGRRTLTWRASSTLRWNAGCRSRPGISMLPKGDSGHHGRRSVSAAITLQLLKGRQQLHSSRADRRFQPHLICRVLRSGGRGRDEHRPRHGTSEQMVITEALGRARSDVGAAFLADALRGGQFGRT